MTAHQPDNRRFIVRPVRRAAWACSLLVAIGLIGCAAERNGVDLLESSADPQPALGRPHRDRVDEVVALINGQPVRLDEITPALLEAAGGTILQEIALDRMLIDEARRRNISVSQMDIDREREEFIQTLTSARLGDPGRRANDRAPSATALLEQVRKARGLGADRFARILRQSALLRAMVRDDVVVTDDMIALAFRIEHGEKRAAHIITTHTLAGAQQALDALDAGQPFVEVAAQRSTDPSADRGGLIEPISPVDPSYPQSIRTTLAAMAPGQISQPIVIDTGFAIVRLDRIDPPDGVSLEAVRRGVARRVRRQQERQKMGDLASRLVRRATTTARNPHLRISSHDR